MSRCPRCRSRVDPTFTTHCPECGQTLVAGVHSMDIPLSDPAGAGTTPRRTLSRRAWGRIFRVVLILVIVFGARFCSAITDIIEDLPREAIAVTRVF